MAILSRIKVDGHVVNNPYRSDREAAFLIRGARIAGGIALAGVGALVGTEVAHATVLLRDHIQTVGGIAAFVAAPSYISIKICQRIDELPRSFRSLRREIIGDSWRYPELAHLKRS
ncbi:MAG: hypothetical protein KGH72_00600 [Candidatus Micrarchaeota archaeon]|nr:hypothetical protein [Candidatus Micrarchaeota archaeon]